MSDYFIGELRVFAGIIPSGWIPCDGRLLQIQANAALYSLLGTSYGGDGKTTFAVPDLRGQTPVAIGQLPAQNLSYQVGNKGGTETVTLLPTQIPPHLHQVTVVSNSAANQNFAAGNLMAQIGTTTGMTPQTYYAPPSSGTTIVLAAQTIGTAGSSAPHSNLQPFLVLNICIAMTGLYPPRP